MSTAGHSETTGTTEPAPEAASTEIPPDSTVNRRQGFGTGFLDTISTGWAERPDILPPPREQSRLTRAGDGMPYPPRSRASAWSSPRARTGFAATTPITRFARTPPSRT